jgi:carbon-monoxide dehydrogenase medium subunit
VALADPAADWPVCLIALDATVHISGPRSTPIRGFITGHFATGLQPGEIITAIEIPALPASARWGVSKLARKTGAFANSLAICIIDGDSITLALGGAVRFACLLDPADIEASVAAADPDGVAYERHCHVVTARRAIAQARAS